MTKSVSCEHHATLLKIHLLLFFSFISENWMDGKEDTLLIRIILMPAFYLCLPAYIILRVKIKEVNYINYTELYKLF